MSASPITRLSQPDLSSMFPEAVPKPESTTYIYPIPDQAPLYKADDVPPVVPQPLPQRRKWTRWPCLLLFGLLLAILGGIIGGFVGKAIEHNRHKVTSPVEQQSNVTSCPPPNSNSTSTPSNATALPIPYTGCPSINGQKLTSAHDIATYQIFCSTGWINDDIIAVSVLTPSDCIEACTTYNSNAINGAKCIGGGFVPSWLNQTKAMEDNHAPFNCLLKHNTSTLSKNERPFEVVSVCLEGECQGTL